MVNWKEKGKTIDVKEEVDNVDPQTEELQEPTEQVPVDYEEVIKIIARDLIKAGIDTATGYDKKLSEVLQNVADKATEITE